MSEPDVASLYREPPETFVERRDAMARELKEAGDDAGAATVKKLRRPTVAAWALNRLAADDPGRVEELLASGRALSEAQRSVMGGGSPAQLHDAAARRRTLVAELTKRTAGILRDGGRSPDAHLEDLQGMLEAASVEPEAGERLRTGTIEKTVRPSSGFGPELAVVDAGGAAAAAQPDDAPMAGATKAERAAALDAEIATLTETAKEQERTAAKAERARERASAAVDASRQRLEAAKASLQQADAELSAAELASRRSHRALETARTARAKLP
jgi:hypothetical protein